MSRFFSSAVPHTYNSVHFQKCLGLVHGMPYYSPIQEFTDAGMPTHTYQYSNDSRLFAFALPALVRISQAENATPMQELNIVKVNFSLHGTYLFAWEHPARSWYHLQTEVNNASMRDFALPSQCGQ
ncbi:hypothetical protein EDC04DRAFT_2602729 [Pisolithus marmoratus]|nr:hypothetical protein EDC04DRAFT_2602729 [Pisolithus marmoratus]